MGGSIGGAVRGKVGRRGSGVSSGASNGAGELQRFPSASLRARFRFAQDDRAIGSSLADSFHDAGLEFPAIGAAKKKSIAFQSNRNAIPSFPFPG